MVNPMIASDSPNMKPKVYGGGNKYRNTRLNELIGPYLEYLHYFISNGHNPDDGYKKPHGTTSQPGGRMVALISKYCNQRR